VKSTKYLYGIEACVLEDAPYKMALKYKVKMAKKVMKWMRLRVKYMTKDHERYVKFRDRYLAAEKAKDFNEELLNELRN